MQSSFVLLLLFYISFYVSTVIVSHFRQCLRISQNFLFKCNTNCLSFPMQHFHLTCYHQHCCCAAFIFLCKIWAYFFREYSQSFACLNICHLRCLSSICLDNLMALICYSISTAEFANFCANFLSPSPPTSPSLICASLQYLCVCVIVAVV